MPNWFAKEASQANVSPSSWTCSSRLPLRTAFANSPVSSASQATLAAIPRAVPFTVGAFHQQLQLVEVSHESSRVLMWCPSSLAGWLATLTLRWKGSDGEVATGGPKPQHRRWVCDDGHELVHAGESRR